MMVMVVVALLAVVMVTVLLRFRVHDGETASSVSILDSFHSPIEDKSARGQKRRVSVHACRAAVMCLLKLPSNSSPPASLPPAPPAAFSVLQQQFYPLTHCLIMRGLHLQILCLIFSSSACVSPPPAFISLGYLLPVSLPPSASPPASPPSLSQRPSCQHRHSSLKELNISTPFFYRLF